MGWTALMLVFKRTNWMLVLLAIAGAAVALTLLWGAWTVKGWRDDALRLPAVEKQRDDAYAEIKSGAARIDAVGAKLDKLLQEYARTDARVSTFDAKLNASTNSFKRMLADAIRPLPQCDYSAVVRGVLEHALERPGDAVEFPSGTRSKAGLPGPAAAPDAMSRREPAPLRREPGSVSVLSGVSIAAARHRRRTGHRSRSRTAFRARCDPMGLDRTAAPSRTRDLDCRSLQADDAIEGDGG